MRGFLSLAFLAGIRLCYASNGEGPIGPRSAALGHASVCITDVWSVTNNQANLGSLKQYEAACFYENRFLIKELSQHGFAIATPIKKGCFGFQFSSLGYKLYRETKSTLAYGISLNDRISAGVGLDVLSTKIADIYGKAMTVSGELGIQVKITRELYFASHVYNPFRAQITSYNHEKIPSIFKLGMMYSFSEKVFLCAEAEKTSLQNINIKGGLEYRPHSLIYIRVGAASYPTQASFGLGVNYEGLKIDVTSSFHQVLGFSPQIGLSYAFGKTTSQQKVLN